MNIGKYTASQILQASVMDMKKVRFGFFGGAIALACLYLGKGLVFGLGLTGVAASIVDLIGSIAFGLVSIMTILGITAEVHAGFSAKKTKTRMFSMAKEKFLPFLGTALLFALGAAIIMTIEYGLYLVGANMFFGPILLGIATPFLLAFNLVAIFILAVGTKLLPAYLVCEKGNIVDAAKTLVLRTYKNMSSIMLNIGLLITALIPMLALLSGLLYGSFMSVVMVDRLVLQQAFFSGGFADLPLFIFALLSGVGFAALVLWLISAVVVFVNSGIYSIYVSLPKK